MDYIPSNKHGDYISHSEEYLMHYGVKGMKWKDHDYVEDVKNGAREVAGNIKSKIKQLKKFVGKASGKAKAKVIEKVDPKLQEHDYLKNHKVHEEQDKREASMKISQNKAMYGKYNGPNNPDLANSISLNVRANQLKTRANFSETSKTNKERKSLIRSVNVNDSHAADNAINAKLKEYHNVGKYNAKQNATMREANERKGYKDGLEATFINKFPKARSKTSVLYTATKDKLKKRKIK